MGAWDQESSLIHDTLTRLPADSPRPAWIHQLGIIAQKPGDHDEAARQHQHSLDINERIGNQASMATSYSQMAALAQDRGEAEAGPIALHPRALAIRLRLGLPRR